MSKTSYVELRPYSVFSMQCSQFLIAMHLRKLSQASFDAWQQLQDHHGLPSGAFGADVS